MTYNPVIFDGKFRSGFVPLPSWALTLDQPGRRDQLFMLLEDERTRICVAILLKLLSDHCHTKKAHEQNAIVTVPTIDISQIRRPATDLTATDLLHVFTYEFTEPGLSKVTAQAVRNQLHLLPGESWMPAAHRTLMRTKAVNIQYCKPHVMEETYYQRTVAGDQLEDHSARITVRGSLAISTPQTRTCFIRFSSTFPLLSGMTSTGGRSMKDNYSWTTWSTEASRLTPSMGVSSNKHST